MSLQRPSNSFFPRLLLLGLLVTLSPQDCTTNLMTGKISCRCHLEPLDGDRPPKPFARTDELWVRGLVLYGMLI